MLEYVFMTNRWLYEACLLSTMAEQSHDHVSLMDAWAEETLNCSKGHEINMGMALVKWSVAKVQRTYMI